MGFWRGLGKIAADATNLTGKGAVGGAKLAAKGIASGSQEGLDAHNKSRNSGGRSVRFYLAYLAGGALAVATNTWWLGVLGRVGTRLVMGSGQAKRTHLNSLKQIVATNERVLKRLGSSS
jgi:hypothetical protein